MSGQRSSPRAPELSGIRQPAAELRLPIAEDELTEHTYTRRAQRWRWIAASILTVGASAALGFYVSSPGSQATHEAQVEAREISAGPRIAGIVQSVHVRANQHVERGELLAELEGGQLQVAVEVAHANLVEAEASLSASKAQAAIALSENQSALADAQLTLAELQARAADSEHERASLRAQLAQLDVTNDPARAQTAQPLHAANERAQRLKQTVSTTRARIAALQINASALQEAREANVLARSARVGAASSQLQEARNAYDARSIVAPCRGVIGSERANPGEAVSAGSPLFTIWQSDNVGVSARFDERQLPAMKPGQPVRLHIPALDIDLRGQVESIAFASTPRLKRAGWPLADAVLEGAERAPVRIALAPGQPAVALLQHGMGVEVDVRTR